MEQKTMGLLLRAIPYLGKQKILKVFTADFGLITLIVNATSSAFQALITPFAIAEWIYKKNQKEIYPLKEGTLFDPLLDLKKNYEVLIAAGTIAQSLLRSQLPEEKSSILYDLACSYLKKLPGSLKPDVFAASFLLKLLAFEGLLSEEREATFTEEEWEQVKSLAFSRQFSLLQKMEKGPVQKIGALLESRFTMT